MERIALITCEFTFEASHQLRRADWSDEKNAAVFGSCVRLHGHSYRLLVTLRGAISPQTGMVENFRDLREAVRERVVDLLDHRHLDHVLDTLSTAENLCYWIAGRLMPIYRDRLHRVELWETRSAFAALDSDALAALAASPSVPAVA